MLVLAPNVIRPLCRRSRDLFVTVKRLRANGKNTSPCRVGTHLSFLLSTSRTPSISSNRFTLCETVGWDIWSRRDASWKLPVSITSMNAATCERLNITFSNQGISWTSLIAARGLRPWTKSIMLSAASCSIAKRDFATAEPMWGVKIESCSRLRRPPWTLSGRSGLAQSSIS